MLIRRGIEAFVGTALVVVAMLAVLPAVAEAQSIATSQEARDADANPAAAAGVVVEPGDSLWSISSEQLGAGATLGQIDREVERIYALNQDRIGADPNLIFVGQRLSVPAIGSRRAPRLDAKATTPAAAREGAPTAAAASPKRRTGHALVSASGGEAIQASRPAPRTPEAGLAAKAEKAPLSGSETPSLPKEADAAPAVPAVRQAASEDSPTTSSSSSPPLLTPLLRSVRSAVASAPSAVSEAFTEVRETAASDRRTTLGWAIVVLTVVVGALMAWKLPMRRTIRSDAQRWRIPTGYYYDGGGRYTSPSGGLDMLVPTAKPEASREQPPEKRLTEEQHFAPAAQLSGALLPAVAIGPTTNNGSISIANGSKANGSGAKHPTEASEQRSGDDESAGKG